MSERTVFLLLGLWLVAAATGGAALAADPLELAVCLAAAVLGAVLVVLTLRGVPS